MTNENQAVSKILGELSLDEEALGADPLLVRTCPDLEPKAVQRWSLRRRVARWCARSIDIGNGAIFTPTVFGPDLIPVVTDAEQARAAPELAVLSARTLEETRDSLRRLLLPVVNALLDGEEFTDQWIAPGPWRR